MLEVLDFHKKLYDARWNGEGEEILSIRQLEDQFVSLATKEGVDMEEINTMLWQLYIPPYKYAMLPEHLKHSNSAKKESAGRPSMGVTKKVSITLPSDIWERIENELKGSGKKTSMSAFFRELTLDRYKGEI